MSEKNGYIKDEDLHTLSKEELVGKVRTARTIWHKDQKTIESLTDQAGKAAGDIEILNAQIEERDQRIQVLEVSLEDSAEAINALTEKLEELCTPIAIACRQVGNAKEILKPYWKHNQGEQND